MNIEEYINLDSALIMIGFVGLLVIMVIYFGFRVASFLLEQQYASVMEEDPEKEERPKQIPMSGQTWYPRIKLDSISWFSEVPWPDKESKPVMILEKRYDWIRYQEEGSDKNLFSTIKEFTQKFMTNEFGDFVEVTVATPEPKKTRKNSENSKSVENSEDSEISPIPAENIVKIDGKDFILTPVKK